MNNQMSEDQGKIDFMTYINTLREDYKREHGRLMTEEEALEYANELQRKSTEGQIKKKEEFDFTDAIKIMREGFEKENGRLLTKEEALEYAKEFQREIIKKGIFDKS